MCFEHCFYFRLQANGIRKEDFFVKTVGTDILKPWGVTLVNFIVVFSLQSRLRGKTETCKILPKFYASSVRAGDLVQSCAV